MSNTAKHSFRIGRKLYLRILAKKRIRKPRIVWPDVGTGTRSPETTPEGFMHPPLETLKNDVSGHTAIERGSNDSDAPVLPKDAMDASGPVATPRAFTGFDRERATYERYRDALLAEHEGRYVVIVGGDLLGPIDTYENALRQGYARFGLGPLYVKQISAVDPVVTTTRHIPPCPN